MGPNMLHLKDFEKVVEEITQYSTKMWYGYKMKIAICISGQLRDSWRDCILHGKNMFEEKHPSGLFYPTWTNKTASMLLLLLTKTKKKNKYTTQK